GCARMIPRGPGGVKRLASRQLHGVAELPELVGDAFAMVALNLHRAVLDRAARAAQALELGGESLEIFRGQSANHRHHLALASSAIAEDAHHAVVRHAWIGRRCLAPANGRREASVLGGVDGTAVLHCAQCSRARRAVAASRATAYTPPASTREESARPWPSPPCPTSRGRSSTASTRRRSSASPRS